MCETMGVWVCIPHFRQKTLKYYAIGRRANRWRGNVVLYIECCVGVN
jgi:hypothetical protein